MKTPFLLLSLVITLMPRVLWTKVVEHNEYRDFEDKGVTLKELFDMYHQNDALKENLRMLNK